MTHLFYMDGLKLCADREIWKMIVKLKGVPRLREVNQKSLILPNWWNSTRTNDSKSRKRACKKKTVDP